MKRRIKRDNNDFTKKFVMVQMTDGLEGDFYPQTKRDMISLNIVMRTVAKGTFT